MRTFFRMSVLAGAWLLAWSGGVRAQHQHEHHHQHQDHAQHQQHAEKPVAGQSTEVRLSDARVLNQDGKSLKFKSDVVGDRIVVVDFVYTTCTTVCPVMSTLLKEVERRIGADLGKDIALVSVSVDPLRDTPRRLKEYAAKYDAGPHWTWITGQKTQVDDVLKAFGAYAPDFTDHPPLVMVGDGQTGKWVRFFGFPNPDQVMSAVNELRTARQNRG